MTRAPESERAIRRDAQRMGFFTDTTVCIGCKACEVACKQWNDLPADGSVIRAGNSYDHTGALGASTWRHVHFVELLAPSPAAVTAAREALDRGAGGAMPALPATELAGAGAGAPASSGEPASTAETLDILAMAGERDDRQGGVDVAGAVADMSRWVFMSDVCKHCTNAGCLDACPTGALIRTEFDTVVLQADVCNGCGYCVSACPFGVVARDHDDGRAAKCTLCYDRLEDGLEPACAKSCPTDSIQFGPYDELVETARRRVATLHERGMTGAYLYGAGDEPGEQLAGGLGAFFLLREPPERYGLPAQAESPIQENVPAATMAALGAGAITLAGMAAVFVRARRRGEALPAAGFATAVAGAVELVAATRRRRLRRDEVRT